MMNAKFEIYFIMLYIAVSYVLINQLSFIPISLQMSKTNLFFDIRAHEETFLISNIVTF